MATKKTCNQFQITGRIDHMLVETIQTEDLSQLDKLINEIIEQRKVVDIKLSVTPFQEKLVYNALIMLEE